MDPNTYSTTNLNGSANVIFNLTDAEGDFDDSTFAYIRNITTNPTFLDSVKFPTLAGIKKKSNLNVDVTASIISVIAASGRPRPHIDTLQFEVYVKDKAKNKSNVITAGPLYYFVQ